MKAELTAVANEMLHAPEKDVAAIGSALQTAIGSVQVGLPYIEGIVTAIDAFDYALKHGAEATERIEEYRGQVLSAIAALGIERFEATPGDRLDPKLCEAIAAVERGPGQAPSEVVEVCRAGYRFGGKVLRVCQVVASRA
ncbi:MAG: nucleotide exchange factor GrpE [Myxococcota bacterium]